MTTSAALQPYIGSDLAWQREGRQALAVALSRRLRDHDLFFDTLNVNRDGSVSVKFEGAGSARFWARRIQAALPGATVTHAEDGEVALVVFTLEGDAR